MQPWEHCEMTETSPQLDLDTLHESPYGWPLRQLRIPQAHRITRGSPDVVLAVIDLGYRYHPHHEGHLWVNPNPTKADIHGWDCHDDDASLEYIGQKADSPYYINHHAFIVGEAVACAPECPVMVVRVGYGNPDSWWKGIDYAVEHGARILVIPHGFITHGLDSPDPLFYRGTDFSYPVDNPELRRALEDAYDAGCLILKGTADNRGRRVAAANAAIDAVVAVGSSSRKGEPADICCSADYVEIAAPGGQRDSEDETDLVWSTGGQGDYVSSTGGCMASGFAGGVCALVMSRFPHLSNEEVRQILRNTTSGDAWNPELGWGILDAERAVSLQEEELGQRLKVADDTDRLIHRDGKPLLQIALENRGAFDIERALVTVFTGDPRKAAAPEASMENPVILVNRQIGHAITGVRGLHSSMLEIALAEEPSGQIWVQAYTLDLHGSHDVETVMVRAGS